MLTEKQTIIRKLQTQLRNEEMALVLLKKIRQSQLLAEAAKAAEAAKIAAKEKAAAMSVAASQHAKDQSSRHHHLNSQQHSHHSSSSQGAGHYSNHSSGGGHHNQRGSSSGGKVSSGGQIGSSGAGAINKMTVGQQLNQSRQHQAAALAQQQLIAAVSGNQGKNALMSELSQLKPVNLQDPKNLPPGLPANLVNLMNKGGLAATASSTKQLPNDHQQQRPSSKPQQPKVVDHETSAQKQAAAKLALRQQLEKTLLQIPPPKPPPPEMHFIPNPTNSEFIYLLGLEECVSKYLNEDKNPGPQTMPFSCSQCHTDFTPTWKWDKGAKGTNCPPVHYVYYKTVYTNALP